MPASVPAVLRLLHTSDWHLGHQLHNLSRAEEHAAFLEWLLEQIHVHEVDALLIAGDIFHTANPSAAATSQWYDFVATLRDRFPTLDLVTIAGNHDSASRVEAPAPLLAHCHTIVGRTHRLEDGEIDLDRMIVEVRGDSGEVEALVLAVPFLRPQDLPPDRDVHGADYLIQGTLKIYRDLVERALAKAEDNQALIAMGHLHMASAVLSENSERRVFGGAEHVPLEAFGPEIGYVALGHLHLPQVVSGQERLRYCGSPIPLSMAERDYKHQVVIVEFEGSKLTKTEILRIPRTVDVLHIPSSIPQPLNEVLDLIENLPLASDSPAGTWPFVEVRVLLPETNPTLRQEIEGVLANKAVRLVRIAVTYTEKSPQAPLNRELNELQPQDLFGQLWSKSHDDDPGPEILDAFQQLVDEAGQRQGGGQ